MKNINFFAKRKKCTAFAILKTDSTGIYINQIPINNIEPKLMKDKIYAALSYTESSFSNLLEKININIKVNGGGVSSRTDAAIVCIMNCILQYLKTQTDDDEWGRKLKEFDRSVLVPDVRRKMRKTILGQGARSKEQKSYR